MDVPVENRSQANAMVGELALYNTTTGSYDAPQPVCGYDSAKLGTAAFTICAAGQTAPSATEKPLRVYMGLPVLSQDVIIYNFNIK